MKKNSAVVAINKAARFNFEILKEVEAGIVLKGSEVKSLRINKANLQESYIKCDKKLEIFIQNFHIAKYKGAGFRDHDPIRLKKLLLHKKEIYKMHASITQKGLTIVPIRAYFNQKGILKINIGLAKGKKLHDKRRDIKKRDLEREQRKEY